MKATNFLEGFGIRIVFVVSIYLLIISHIYYDILIWIYILSRRGMLMNASIKALKQSHRLGYTAGFVGILYLEFADDLLTMAAYGVNADVQLTGDFLTFHSHIYHWQYLALAAT